MFCNRGVCTFTFERDGTDCLELVIVTLETCYSGKMFYCCTKEAQNRNSPYSPLVITVQGERQFFAEITFLNCDVNL